MSDSEQLPQDGVEGAVPAPADEQAPVQESGAEVPASEDAPAEAPAPTDEAVA